MAESKWVGQSGRVEPASIAVVVVLGLLGVLLVAVLIPKDDDEQFSPPLGVTVWAVDASGSQDLDGAGPANLSTQRRSSYAASLALEAAERGEILVVNTFAATAEEGGAGRVWDLSEERIGCFVDDGDCSGAREKAAAATAEEIDALLAATRPDGKTDTVAALYAALDDARNADVVGSEARRRVILESDFVHTTCDELGDDPRAWTDPAAAAEQLTTCRGGAATAIEGADVVVLRLARASDRWGLSDTQQALAVFLAYCERHAAPGVCEVE
jgi:hypothetical protein